MSEPFLGEVRAFSIPYAPRGWAQCNGQTLSIAQNQALYALLGTTYGGNGQTTFCLPNLNGRVPVHPDQQSTRLGEMGGEERHTLTVSEIPAHNHTVSGSNGEPNTPILTNNVWTASSTKPFAATPTTPMSSNSLSATGDGSPHENRQPYTVVNYCIALQGIFPSRN
ncbi:tail fiber protein [Bacillus carboniphilus]|uniref:Tail fiber protein n=1 Tax=Bacillus carboniphilus TaxID=86663 RepID=A0ABN0VXL2_9BACI